MPVPYTARCEIDRVRSERHARSQRERILSLVYRGKSTHSFVRIRRVDTPHVNRTHRLRSGSERKHQHSERSETPARGRQNMNDTDAALILSILTILLERGITPLNSMDAQAIAQLSAAARARISQIKRQND